MNSTISKEVNRILLLGLILVFTMTACTPNVERLMEKGDVEELIAALNYERDPEVRAEAALALGKLGEAEAMKPLISTLSDDEDETVRSAAAEAIGQICTADAVEPLMHALEDESEDVRETSKSALVLCSDAAVNSLYEALGSENEDLRQSVVEVFSLMDSSVSLDLAKLLINSDGNIRSGAYDALVMIGSPAIPYIIEAVKETSKVVFNDEVFIASEVRYGPYGTAEGLLADGGACTKTRNWEDKIVLCEMSEKSFDEKMLNVQEGGGVGVIYYNGFEGNIYPSLSDSSDDVHIVSVGVSQQASQVLLANALWKNVQIFSEEASGAIDVLPAFGESAIPYLLDAVKDPAINNTSTSYLFQDVLVSMGPIAVPAIIEMLDESNADVRFNAINMLGQIDDERVVAALIESLEDPEIWIKRVAIKNLGKTKSLEAVDPLVNCLSDEEIDIQEASLEALTSIGMPAVDLLMEMYHDPTTSEKGLIASALKSIFRENADVVAEVVASVCLGEALVDSAEYDPYDGDAHPTIILDENGEVHSWTYKLPVDWFPYTSEMLELVVCLGDEVKKDIQVCEYSYVGSGADAPSITRYQYLQDAALHAAYTGNMIDSTTLSGPLPDACPQTIFSSMTSITGDNIGISELATWLQNFDIPLGK